VKHICYYISDYGYGHAARSIALIRYLLNASPEFYVTICTSFTIDFIKHSLHTEDEQRTYYREVENDIGFVLRANSIEMDLEGMLTRYQYYLQASECYITQEAEYLSKNRFDVVIGDIPPFSIVAAKQANLLTIGISNFSWFTAYSDFIDEALLIPLKEANEHMDYFIKLAGSDNEPDWAKQGVLKTGFYCREMNQKEVARIRQQINPDGKKTVVYFGLGMKIGVEDLSNLKLWDSKDCTFIVASNTNVDGPNIVKIPPDYTETQNYIAASDIVISKPGWSTVSEAVQADKPLLILDRKNMREDQNMIHYLKERNRCHLLSWSEIPRFEITEDLLHKLNKQVECNRFISKRERTLTEICDFIQNILGEKVGTLV